jgi:hypothetical protein
MEKNHSKKPINQRRPPGDGLKKLAARNVVVHSIFEHTHVLQIIEDHQAMWHTTDDEAQKRLIARRCHKQLALAFVNVAGVEMALHGTYAAIATDPFHGGSLLVFGLLIMHIAGRKG